jgi:hypothetical protein
MQPAMCQVKHETPSLKTMQGQCGFWLGFHMSMEQWWNGKQQGKADVLGKKLRLLPVRAIRTSHCQSVLKLRLQNMKPQSGHLITSFSI